MRIDTDGLLTSNVLRFGNVMKADGRSKMAILRALRERSKKVPTPVGPWFSSFTNFHVCGWPKLADKIRVGELGLIGTENYALSG